MRTRWPAGLTLLVVLCGHATAAPHPSDVAQAVARPPGAPEASGVIMRSLRLHPANAKDPHDTMRALKAFHVTRLAWTYINDKAFIDRVRASGRVFGGAAAAPSYIRDDKPDDWFEQVVVLDLAGKPIIAPWKRTWKRTLWGCINNPEFERGYLAWLRQYIDAGAQVMQRDEPTANHFACRWGGCFCKHCIAGFRPYLARHTTPEERRKLGIADVATFDVRAYFLARGAPVGDAFARYEGGRMKELFEAFQLAATVAFHQRTRRALDAYARRHVPVSCNNGARRWSVVEKQFDWLFGELAFRHATAVQVHHIFANARRHGQVQVVTMPKKGDRTDLPGWQRRTRRAIATVYACGGLCMVPWDVYMPRDAPRYFGTPEQYADLFALVRAARELLDGYAYAGAVGKGIPCDLYGQAGPPVRLPADRPDLFACLRAKLGRPKAPVVVHLVDWSDQPKPAVVTLDSKRIATEGPVRAVLVTPTPYDKAGHVKAEQTGDYAPLRTETPLRIEPDGRIRLPALRPWGILVVRAGGAQKP